MIQLCVAALLLGVTLAGDMTKEVTKDKLNVCFDDHNARYGAKVLAKAINQVEAKYYSQLNEYFTADEESRRKNHPGRRIRRSERFKFLGTRNPSLRLLAKEFQKSVQSDIIVGENLLTWMYKLKSPLFTVVPGSQYLNELRPIEKMIKLNIWQGLEEGGLLVTSDRFKNSMCRLGVNLMRIEFFGRVEEKSRQLLQSGDKVVRNRAIKTLEMINSKNFIKDFLPELVNYKEFIEYPDDDDESEAAPAVNSLASMQYFVRGALHTMKNVCVKLRFQHHLTKAQEQITSLEMAYTYALDDAIPRLDREPEVMAALFHTFVTRYREKCLRQQRKMVFLDDIKIKFRKRFHSEANIAVLHTLFLFLSTDPDTTIEDFDTLSAFVDCGTLFRALWLIGGIRARQHGISNTPRNPQGDPTHEFLKLLFPRDGEPENRGQNLQPGNHGQNLFDFMELLHDIAIKDQTKTTSKAMAEHIASDLCAVDLLRLDKAFLASVIESYNAKTVATYFPADEGGGAAAAANQ